MKSTTLSFKPIPADRTVPFFKSHVRSVEPRKMVQKAVGMHRNKILNRQAATRSGSSTVRPAYCNAKFKVPSHEVVEKLIDNAIRCVSLL